jgi:glycosyltransferase involved in cell wall biosynthesis
MLTLARLAASERYKGIDEVLDVMPMLLDDFPTLSYLIAGDGDDRQRLERKAAALGLADKVVFSGYVREEEKADTYRLADVFVMPGRGEGFGIVYLEALACGIPVVASTADASGEAVGNGSMGYLANPDRPSEIVAAIRRALKDEKGVPTELQRFSYQAFRDRCHALLDEISASQSVDRRRKSASRLRPMSI